MALRRSGVRSDQHGSGMRPVSVGAQQNREKAGPLPEVKEQPAGFPDRPGALYARLTGLPLLLLGWFKPAPVIIAWLLLAALVVPFAWRRIPSVAGGLGWGAAHAPDGRRTPRWTIVALAAVSV